MGIFNKIQNEWSANFTNLIVACGNNEVDHFCNKLYEGYCQQFTSAGYLKNVEWMLRHYQASKKLMLSAVYFKQSEFLLSKQMNNIIFYAMYYSLFNAFSANIIQIPYLQLNSVVKISHSKVFAEITNYLIAHGIYDNTYIELLNNLRLTREAYSYNLPLGSRFDENSGSLSATELFDNISNRLPVIFQVSNLLSYLSYYAWNKKVGEIPDEYDKCQSECDEMFFSFIEIHDYLGKHCLIDDDDYYRQGRLLLKSTTPLPIDCYMIEKMCEDLECGWGEKVNDYCFDINDVTMYISGILEA